MKTQVWGRHRCGRGAGVCGRHRCGGGTGVWGRHRCGRGDTGVGGTGDRRPVMCFLFRVSRAPRSPGCNCKYPCLDDES